MVLLGLVPEHLGSSGLAGVCGCPLLLETQAICADMSEAFSGVLHGLGSQQAL